MCDMVKESDIMTKVLLVEDDLGNRTVMEDIFQFDNVGAELIVAESGEEALCLAVDNKPILILMDIHLPGMDGLDAARALKSDPRTKEMPIWAITAYARTEDRDKALAAGCDDYIAKPFERSELVTKLRGFVASAVKRG